MHSILEFLRLVWLIWTEMAPYLLIGFTLAGILNAIVSPEHVTRFLGTRGAGQIMRATLLGIPLPVCSCGVMPLAKTLRAKGASRGATAAFVLTTPQTGIDSIVATYGILGGPVAMLRVGVALIAGTLAGWAAYWTEGERVQPNRNEHTQPATCCSRGGMADADSTQNPKRASWRSGLRFALLTLPRQVVWPVTIGLSFAAVIQFWIPVEAWSNLDVSPWATYLTITLISLPVYVCSTGAIPITAGLLSLGISPGAALLFLVGGPAVNSGTFALLRQEIGLRATCAALAALVFTLWTTAAGIDFIIPASFSDLIQQDSHDHLHDAASIHPLSQFLTLVMTLIFAVSLIKK